MNPVLHPEAWDVTIAGVTWSGSATVSGLKYSMGWDVKEATGQSGASMARKGRTLSKFTVRFEMVYDPTQEIDQFEDWYSTWIPLLKSCFVGTDPVGLSFEYADAQALEVDSVVVAEIGAVDGDKYSGYGYSDVAFIQYAPARNVTTSGPGKTKSGTGGGGAGAGANDPNDPIQQRINALDALLDGP